MMNNRNNPLDDSLRECDLAVLANGAPPTGAALDVLRSARVLVACDGAAAKARALGREPDFVVGDGDSLSASEIASLGGRFVRISEQETNDLAKAVRFACEKFPLAKSLVIIGAHGLREDHFLGNVSRLPDFAEEFARAPARPRGTTVAMLTDSGRFDVVVGSRTFPARAGDPVSIFAFRPGVNASSDGLAWPLGGVSLDALWKGTLNRAEKDRFTISAESPVVVYRPFV